MSVKGIPDGARSQRITKVNKPLCIWMSGNLRGYGTLAEYKESVMQLISGYTS